MTDTAGIPALEFKNPYVRYAAACGDYYVTQSRPPTDKKPFTLWKPTPKGYTKSGTAETPQKLYDLIPKTQGGFPGASAV